jgi:Ca-activated chloride channel homolog
MVRFENSEYLFALILTGIFLVFFILGFRTYRKKLEAFGDLNLIKKLIKDKAKYKKQLKFILRILAFTFLILALANLQFGSTMEKVKREGLDIVLALDLSNSMMSEDIKPNRLEKARQFIYTLIESLSNDRIGLIVFAGKAYIQMPLTVDYEATRLFLASLNTRIIPTQGTAIGEAIELSQEMFEQDTKKHKVLIIISDGENHEGKAKDAAEKAKNNGTIIYTIGVGTPKGAPIPVYRGNTRMDFRRDKNNNIILSKIDDLMLQEIAAIANGKYFRISNTQYHIKDIVKALNKEEKKEIDSRIFSDYESKFQYFLFAAFILLFLDSFIFEKRSTFKFDLASFKFIKNED